MNPETVIHTIRHGSTEYNAEKRYAGTLDISLSEKGICECRVAAQKLEDYHFDIILTSKMKRAIETAKLMVDGKVPVIQNALCNERNFGLMEGYTWDEILRFDPPILLINVGNDLHTVNPARGEPFEDVWQRAKKFRNFLFRKFQGQSILVISHGVFLQMFHGVLRNLNCIESLARFPSNLELATFIFSGGELIEEKMVKLLDVKEPKW
jgi:broad specificity phosphatase PhoE